MNEAERKAILARQTIACEILYRFLLGPGVNGPGAGQVAWNAGGCMVVLDGSL